MGRRWSQSPGQVGVGSGEELGIWSQLCSGPRAQREGARPRESPADGAPATVQCSEQGGDTATRERLWRTQKEEVSSGPDAVLSRSAHGYGLPCTPTPGNHPLGTSHSSGAHFLALTTFVVQPSPASPRWGPRSQILGLLFAHPPRVALGTCLALLTSKMEKLAPVIVCV